MKGTQNMTRGTSVSNPVITAKSVTELPDETRAMSTTITVLTFRFASWRGWCPPPHFVPSTDPGGVLGLGCCWRFWFCNDLSMAFKSAAPNTMKTIIVVTAVTTPGHEWQTSDGRRWGRRGSKRVAESSIASSPLQTADAEPSLLLCQAPATTSRFNQGLPNHTKYNKWPKATTSDVPPNATT